jgi:pilus assembly protein CpaE
MLSLPDHCASGGPVQLSILLLATDRLAAESLTEVMTRTGSAVTIVADPGEVLRQAAGYGLIVIDQLPPGATVEALATELRGTPAMSGIPILCIAQHDDLEERIRYLEAGADDVISKPFDPRELEARVEALALRSQRSRDRGVPVAPTVGVHGSRGLAVVLSPKGGVGTTMIAVNLAVLAAMEHPDTVAIIDLDLQFGQVATHLNLPVRQSLLELTRDETALREPELLRTYAMRHERGLHVIAAPSAPGFASLITADHVEAVISRALEAFPTTVVDAGASLDERTLAAVSRADTVIIPVIPEVPSLRAVHALLDQLSENGAVGGRTMFVLNHVFSRELLRLRDIEAALGGKISADLPYDPFLYLKAANEGVPVVLGAPRSAAADRLRRLAATVFGSEAAAVSATPGQRRTGVLGGLLRRS